MSSVFTTPSISVSLRLVILLSCIHQVRNLTIQTPGVVNLKVASHATNGGKQIDAKQHASVTQQVVEQGEKAIAKAGGERQDKRKAERGRKRAAKQETQEKRLARGETQAKIRAAHIKAKAEARQCTPEKITEYRDEIRSMLQDCEGDVAELFAPILDECHVPQWRDVCRCFKCLRGPQRRLLRKMQRCQEFLVSFNQVDCLTSQEWETVFLFQQQVAQNPGATQMSYYQEEEEKEEDELDEEITIREAQDRCDCCDMFEENAPVTQGTTCSSVNSGRGSVTAQECCTLPGVDYSQEEAATCDALRDINCVTPSFKERVARANASAPQVADQHGADFDKALVNKAGAC